MNKENRTIPSASALFAIDGRKIKSVREKQKLTQLYVATSLGVTVDTISRWENGRSPNIKLENAEKLAEVLGLELADIAMKPDQPEPPPAQQKETGKAIGMRWTQQPVWCWWFAGLVLVGLSVFLTLRLPASKETARLKVQRLLPPHAALNQPFPVILKVTSQDSTPPSFILKEQVGDNCQVIEGSPAFMVVNKQQRFIKWLSQTHQPGPYYFSYLARSGNETKSGDTLFFKGQAKATDIGAVQVEGDQSLTIANYHWADANRDYVIDDEEILTLYSSIKVMQELGIDMEEIRRIWASHGYRWDEDTEEFVALDEKKGEGK